MARDRIRHGLFENFGQDINFLRLITLLDLLCFSIGLIEGGVSMFAPADSPESTALAARYLELRHFIKDSKAVNGYGMARSSGANPLFQNGAAGFAEPWLRAPPE